MLQFVTEHAITTYEGLCSRCERMGVSPSIDEDYKVGVLSLVIVNSPQESVIVVEPPAVIDEMSGNEIDPDAPVIPGVSVVVDHEPELEAPVVATTEPSVSPQKRSRKKKDVPPIV